MVNGVIKRFDLYDFFSVLLPGVGLLIGLYPLFPARIRVDTLGAVILFLVISFFVGRALHVVAANYDKENGRQTHREAFQMELLENDLVDETLAKQFYRDCRNEFGEVHLEDWPDREGNSTETFDGLYSLVRGYVHIDARGRSRTFQAIFAFYRSVQWEALMLTGVYLTYGVLSGLPTLVELLPWEPDWLLYTDVLPYTTKAGFFEASTGLMVLGMFATSAVAYRIFDGATDDYQDHYIQYLVTDFLILRHSTVDSDTAGKPPSGVSRPARAQNRGERPE